MKKLQNQKGVTLVELLAGLAIGGIIITLAMSVFIFLFQFVQDQEQEIVDRSQNHLLNTVLSRNLSSPITVYYWDANELRFKNQDEVTFRILFNSSVNELTISKCSSCTNIKTYSNETVVEKLQNVKDMSVINASPSQDSPITNRFTLRFILDDISVRTNGEKINQEKEISWTVTPLNVNYNKPPN
ncbi:type II secretion system protein [Pontibacillus sp. HMF3514]|uniref:type II secretion system protein n=1 Tax=Pontibacillus sp. HMF3514 TaxID=2692425 RepID=UPI00131FEC06|nr:type II secretion system protein [Pontibacillus sp. HMF3514]QHE53150.1 prepilin-type N-terminal cleavage/methylation domain-containing protein [Pontibacillus sp. HMF3514]